MRNVSKKTFLINLGSIMKVLNWKIGSLLRTMKMGGLIYNIQENLLKIRVFSENDYQRPRHWHLVHKNRNQIF